MKYPNKVPAAIHKFWLILVKFRGEWSIDCQITETKLVCKLTKELAKTNDRVTAVSCDTNDPEKLEKIVKHYNKHF